MANEKYYLIAQIKPSPNIKGWRGGKIDENGQLGNERAEWKLPVYLKQALEKSSGDSGLDKAG